MTSDSVADHPVLVTGTAGFIGGAIARYLRAQRWPIVSLDVSGTPDLRLDAADAEVLGMIRRGTFRAVVHHAGISNTLEQDRQRLLEHNTRKPLQIADAAAKADIPFIYASSFSVYGATGRRTVREADLASSSGPLNAYAESKLLLDQEMTDRFAGGDWLGLRYTNVFGPNETIEGRMASLISKWLRQSASGNPIEIFDGTDDSGRDFVEVDRILTVIRRRLSRSARPQPRGVFNLGSGTTVTFRQLISWCGEFSGQAPTVRTVPFTIGHQYQHWTAADVSALAHYHPDLTWADREGLKDYAGLCWRAFRTSA